MGGMGCHSGILERLQLIVIDSIVELIIDPGITVRLAQKEHFSAISVSKSPNTLLLVIIEYVA